MSGYSAAIARVIDGAEGASLKRLAWAFGCAKKGSDEERQLEQLLIERVRTYKCRECDSDVEVDSIRCSACVGQDLGMREVVA